MREIHLTNGKGIALVDDEDYEAAMEYLWCFHPDGYAQTNNYVGEKRMTLRLHKLVSARMGITGKIDHKNRDPLDCRRENLRPYTSQSQNQANRGIRKDNRLGVKGVKQNRYGGYDARICVDYTQMHLGSFDTIQEASDAYWAAAQKYFGEFACRG